jgi:hypothetical protein
MLNLAWWLLHTQTNLKQKLVGFNKQMYDESTMIGEGIALLQRYEESNHPHNREVFSCMIHFLFDEYEFFQFYYPPFPTFPHQISSP